MNLDLKIDAELKKIKELSQKAKRIDTYESQMDIVNELHDSFDSIHHLMLNITVEHMNRHKINL